MRYKAVWISFWMTMMYWLGGAFGCAPVHSGDTNDVTGRLQASDHSENETIASPHESFAQDYLEGEGNRSPETKTSLRGLDRSHWSTLTVVRPVDGTTPHGWLLFKDLPIDSDDSDRDAVNPKVELNLDVVTLPAEDFSRVHENATIVQMNLINAMKGTKANNWSQSNSIHLIAQPVKMSVDLATFPFRHIVKPDPPQTDEIDQVIDEPSDRRSEEYLQP